MTNLGPVDVTTLDFDGKEEDKPKVHALTALLRERLAKTGLLPPPAVPAGSPQTNLIAAIETSGAPQAAWIAKLLEILPQPPRAPEFKLSGALLGAPARQDSNDDANADAHPALADTKDDANADAQASPADPKDDANADAQPPPADTPAAGGEVGESCGLAYWLQPKRQGRMQVEKVDRQSTHADAIESAAADIFLSISRDAAHLFPPWSRWQSAECVPHLSQGHREPRGARRWRRRDALPERGGGGAAQHRLGSSSPISVRSTLGASPTTTPRTRR